MKNGKIMRFFSTTVFAFFASGVLGEAPCSLSVSGLRAWLLSLNLPHLSRHADALFARAIDGSVLCRAPKDWLYEQLQPVSETSELQPSSTHVCSSSSTVLVANATTLFSKQPSQALDALSSARMADGLCCAPFREFSRFFLGSDSPYIKLEVRTLSLGKKLGF